MIKQGICLTLGSACAQEHTYTHIHRYGGEGRGGMEGGRREGEGAPFSEILPWPNTVYKWSDANNDLL